MLELGSRLELFVDGFLIDRLTDLRLQLHSPRPAGVALRFDRPWEGLYCAYATVLQDGPARRLYYRGWMDSKAKDSACYCLAESEDGREWRRERLGLHEHAGSRDNNIFLAGHGSHAFSPFLDARPGVPEDQRYKALGNASLGMKGLMGFASADGVRWRMLSDQPVLTRGAFDSQNVAFWSEHEGGYVSYYRVWSETPDWKIFKGKRTIARATSDDFLHWSDPVMMDFGGTPLEELYTNATFPYPRAPHLYVALPKRFVKDRRVLSDEQVRRFQLGPKQEEAISEGVFMTSRGGSRYDRTFLEAFVRPGLDAQNWAARSTMAAWGCLQTAAEELSLYYVRHYAQPSCFLERMALRLDGFSSVHAGYAGGELLTKPFTFAGSQFLLNLSTSAAGGARVEVQDATGRALPGRSLEDAVECFGDQIEMPVRWKAGGDVSAWAGKPVRLRIVLRDADLYALRFR